jgi:hypothetical protein
MQQECDAELVGPSLAAQSQFTSQRGSAIARPGQIRRWHCIMRGQRALVSPAIQLNRARELDALATVLPIAAADRYAAVLTDADFATLKHLACTEMGANTLRALASDLADLEALCRAATGGPLPWPPDPGLVLKFVAHHMWDPDQRAFDAAHGMPDDVAEDH